MGLALPVFCAFALWWGNKNEADISFGLALSLAALIGLNVVGFVYVLDLLGDLQKHNARPIADKAVIPTREGRRTHRCYTSADFCALRAGSAIQLCE